MLSYCEDSIPGTSRLERFEVAMHHGLLALEVANRDDISVEQYRQTKIQVTAIQAYEMHDFHPIHIDPERRSRALAHVFETLELAAQLSCPRIVTVCGFGNDLADQPFQRCLDFFAACIHQATKLGIRIMIEPLSPKRCAAMTRPNEIAQLIQMLDEPEVFSLMLDTGHLLDSGIELNAFFRHWNYPIEELQLKGPNSTPPNLNMPFETWLKLLPTTPAVICVEHRRAIAPESFTQLIHALNQRLNP